MTGHSEIDPATGRRSVSGSNHPDADRKKLPRCDQKGQNGRVENPQAVLLLLVASLFLRGISGFTFRLAGKIGSFQLLECSTRPLPAATDNTLLLEACSHILRMLLFRAVTLLLEAAILQRGERQRQPEGMLRLERSRSSPSKRGWPK